MSHKIYDDAVVKGSVTAEAPASTGAYRVLVHNSATKKIESVDPADIGGGGTPAGCYTVCGIIHGLNSTPFELKYSVESNGIIIKPENIVESYEPQYPFFADFQRDQFYGAFIYPSLLIGDRDDNPTPPNYSQAVALVISRDGLILFAKTMSPNEINDYIAANPVGPWEIPWAGFEGSVGVYDWGYIVLNQFPMSVDTNDQNLGVLALGWENPFVGAGTTFSSSVNMIGGGKGAGPLTLETGLSMLPWQFQSDSFATNQWGSVADSGELVITGTNNEGIDLDVVVMASFNSSLNFSERVTAGSTYSKTVPLTVQQLLDNDFYINIKPAEIS